MAEQFDYGVYAIRLDRSWSLEDLYVFPRAFEQVYFALEAILPAPDEITEQRIDRAFTAFPWRGGYSAVNFYNQLKQATPRDERPQIKSIEYASPGWMEIYLALGLAVPLGMIVRSVAKTISRCNATYHEIWRDLSQRELLAVEAKRAQLALSREELDLVLYYSDQMAQVLQIPSAQTIHARTKNPLVSLKILMSIYRRVRTLAGYEIRGKAHFPGADGAPDEEI